MVQSRNKACALLALGLSLAGCAAYHPLPLPVVLTLKTQPSVSGPLTPAQVAMLAVRNDPDLIAARAQHGVTAAALLTAGLPPDPSFSGGFAALLSGPAAMPALSAGLAQDISTFFTYRATRLAAKSGLAQIDADILWQEWQVADQAEQLCVTLVSTEQALASLHADASALRALNQAVRSAVSSGDLTVADASASATTLAGIEAGLNTQDQTQAQTRNHLDALLGLAPGVAIALIIPKVTPIPAAVVQRAIETLPSRRPDLIALRYGYQQANETLRAAIISQFLPISIGASGGRDASGVASMGPQVTLTLPLFNHNRAAIKVDEASSAALRAQYAASLDAAVAGAGALEARLPMLQTQLTRAEAAATQAHALAQIASRAYRAGTIDARAQADLIAAAGERLRETIALRTQLQTGQFSLATLLGLGLPSIVPPDTTP
ncbi:MAG: hypothetical protein B7X08_06555 [Acidocella sp. 20-63-7]|nr:MAG: hypothetical protein B7X08_06555 [Acidocella sp. 20-63-7]HQT47093.1 TolC family protein [Acidocella sp.]